MNNFEICDEIDKCLYRLELDEKLAVATSRLHVNVIPMLQNNFCFTQSQNIQNYFVSFLIKKNFSLRNQFDHIIKRIETSGIFFKWKQDLQVYHNSNVNREIRKMNTTDLQFMFTMLLCTTAASLVIVLLEIFINYKVKSRNSSKFWKLLDKIICGERQFFLLDAR